MTDGPAGPPPGWYPDPSGLVGQRWWDGQQWTDQTRPLTMSSDWRAWFTWSPKAQTVGRVVACAAALCAAGAVLVIVALLVRDKPLNGATTLLIPAIPTLAVGQLWMIASLNARTPRYTGGWRDRMRASRATRGNPRAFFFRDLPSWLGRTLLALAFLGWVSAATAFPALMHGGGPADAGDGCPYRLSSHGTYTCVSKQTYQHAGAGEQRLAGGVLLAFFAIHTGAALGGLRRRPAR